MANKAKKTTAERKRYEIDFTDWLDTGEALDSVTFEVTPSTGSPVVIDDIAVLLSGHGCEFYASAGDDGVTYSVVATATTSGAQTKEVEITFFVNDLV